MFFALLALTVAYMWSLTHAANNSVRHALHGNSKFGELRVPCIFGGSEPKLFAAPPAVGTQAVPTTPARTAPLSKRRSAGVKRK